MLKKEIVLKGLPGCNKCNRQCQFNRHIASPSNPAFSQALVERYGCNSYSKREGYYYNDNAKKN